MTKMLHEYPERITMLERLVLRQAIEIAGHKHNLQPGAAADVAERIAAAYYPHIDTG